MPKRNYKVFPLSEEVHVQYSIVDSFLKCMLCVCVRVRVGVGGHVHLYTGALRGQKEVTDSLQLKLQATGSCSTRILGIDLGFSARGERALTCSVTPATHRKPLHREAEQERVLLL